MLLDYFPIPLSNICVVIDSAYSKEYNAKILSTSLSASIYSFDIFYFQLADRCEGEANITGEIRNI